MPDINYEYEYSLNQSDIDYSNGGGYLEIELVNNNINVTNISDTMCLDGFLHGSCQLYPNVTRADPTVNLKRYPTLKPTWDIYSADYSWDVASAENNEIGVVLFTESQALTCNDRTGCQASQMFLIEGECLYPWMSIEIVETDFNGSSIYVNNEYVGMCDALDDWCGRQLVPCSEENIYELMDYFNRGANGDTDYSNVIVVSLNISQEVDAHGCSYYSEGYRLYASLTLGCFNYKNISGNFTNIRICNNTYNCSNEILSNFDIIHCLDSYSCSNITVYNAHGVWCHHSYSCINSLFENIDYLTCYGI